MGCLARRKRRSKARDQAAAFPSVTVALVVRNEQDRIKVRLENLLGGDFPPQDLSVLVVSDGSNDQTAKMAAAFPDRRVRVLDCSQRGGKASCLNRVMKEAGAEIVVFADARQRFAPDTIFRLVAWFRDPAIGAVSGNLSIEASGSSVGQGVDVYWRIERMLRESEARFDSSIGCTGAVYAVRRELLEAIPEDTILDDVVIPMQIALKGYRVGFDREAHAFDPQPLEPEKERARKRRTLAGNLQMLCRYPGWLLPWRNRLWWQLISHKYFRLFSPLFLALMLGSNVSLAREAPYGMLLAGQGLFFALGFLGLFFPGLKRAGLSIPSGFLFLNWMVVEACWQFAFGPKSGCWEAAPAITQRNTKPN